MDVYGQYMQILLESIRCLGPDNASNTSQDSDARVNVLWSTAETLWSSRLDFFTSAWRTEKTSPITRWFLAPSVLMKQTIHSPNSAPNVPHNSIMLDGDVHHLTLRSFHVAMENSPKMWMGMFFYIIYGYYDDCPFLCQITRVNITLCSHALLVFWT